MIVTIDDLKRAEKDLLKSEVKEHKTSTMVLLNLASFKSENK